MKLLCLISGGIDSPVAGYLMLKKGYDVEFLHLNLYPFGRTRSCTKAKILVSKLGEHFNHQLNLHFIDHSKLLENCFKKTERKHACVLCRRQMLRQGAALAKKIGAKALVTGESLGQVASQTIENLYVEDKAISMSVIRPLIGLNKEEIIKVSRKIGTYDISVGEGGCCQAYPRKPETRARLKQIEEQEELINDK